MTAKKKADLTRERDLAMEDFRGHMSEDAPTIKDAERIFKAAGHSLKQALSAQAKLKAFGKPKVKKTKPEPPPKPSEERDP